MSDDVTENKGLNHKRNLLIIGSVFVLGYLAFNVVGAVQCLSNGGDIQMISGGLGCYMDFSNR